MKFPYHGRKDMRRLKIEVVPGPIVISRHYRYKISPVLLIIISAKLYRGNLGYGIRFIGRLQTPRQQIFLFHGLGREFRVYAGRPEIKQLGTTGGVDDIGGDHNIVINELAFIGIVRKYAAHLGSAQKDAFGLLIREKFLYIGLSSQVKLLAGPGDDIFISLQLKRPE